jgi:hypothetical protein
VDLNRNLMALECPLRHRSAPWLLTLLASAGLGDEEEALNLKAGIPRQRRLHDVSLELGVWIRKAKRDLNYRGLVFEVEVNAVVTVAADSLFRVPRTELCFHDAPQVCHESIRRVIAPAGALPPDKEAGALRGKPVQ